MMNKVGLALRLAILVLAALGFQHLVVEPWRCNRILRHVMESSRAALSAPSTREAVQRAAANLAILEQRERGCLMKVDYYLIVAANNLILGRRDPALRAFQDALKIEHRPEIYFDLGTTLLEEGRVAEATPFLIKAVRFNPMMLDGISGEARERVAAGAGLR